MASITTYGSWDDFKIWNPLDLGTYSTRNGHEINSETATASGNSATLAGTTATFVAIHRTLTASTHGRTRIVAYSSAEGSTSIIGAVVGGELENSAPPSGDFINGLVAYATFAPNGSNTSMRYGYLNASGGFTTLDSKTIGWLANDWYMFEFEWELNGGNYDLTLNYYTWPGLTLLDTLTGSMTSTYKANDSIGLYLSSKPLFEIFEYYDLT